MDNTQKSPGLEEELNKRMTMHIEDSICQEDEATASVRMKGVGNTGPSNPLGVGITKATGKKAVVDHNKTIIKGPVGEVTKLSLIRKLMIPL